MRIKIRTQDFCVFFIYEFTFAKREWYNDENQWENVCLKNWIAFFFFFFTFSAKLGRLSIEWFFFLHKLLFSWFSWNIFNQETTFWELFIDRDAKRTLKLIFLRFSLTHFLSFVFYILIIRKFYRSFTYLQSYFCLCWQFIQIHVEFR